MDHTVHGILQARILEWVAFPFSRGSFQPRDRTQVSLIAGRFFISWATKNQGPILKTFIDSWSPIIDFTNSETSLLKKVIYATSKDKDGQANL